MLSLHRNRGGRDRGRGDGLSRDSHLGLHLSAVPPSMPDMPGDVPIPAKAVPVLLSAGLAELAPAMAAALGPGFAVQTDGLAARGVMIVGPVGSAGVAFLRASHPAACLLVVDRRWSSSQPNEAVLHLEAGADGYLASPVVAEVVSHVKALARRSGLEPNGGLEPPEPAPDGGLEPDGGLAPPEPEPGIEDGGESPGPGPARTATATTTATTTATA